MAKNKYDFIAKIFTGDDDLRPTLFYPAVIGESVYATDAHVCIKFPKKLATLDYSSNDNFPNAEKIFEELNLTEKVVLNTELLLSKVFDCNVIFDDKFKKCDTCGGDGEVECKCCGNDSECKDCKGEGEIRCKTPYAGITVKGDDIMILGKQVSPKFIYKVVECALLLGQEFITVEYNKENLQLIFKMLDVEILVMTKIISTP